MMKAFLLLAIFLLLSASFAQSFFTEEQRTIDVRSHITTIHSQIQSNRDTLVSGIRTLSDIGSGLSSLSPLAIPKSCFYNPPTAVSVEDCVKDFRSAKDAKDGIIPPAACAARTFKAADCAKIFPVLIQAQIRRIAGEQTNATIRCYNTIQLFSLNVSNICTAAITQLTNTPTSGGMGAVLNAQCAILSGPAFANCKATLKDTAAVEAACPAYPLGLIISTISSVTSVIEGPVSALCVKDETDPSQTCLSGVLSEYTAFEAKFDVAGITDSILNRMCKPCMLMILDKIASFGGVLKGPLVALQVAVTAIQVICTKDPTDSSKYCVKVFGNAVALQLKTKTDTPSDDDFSLVCNPCLNAMLSKAAENKLFAPARIPLAALSAICVKDRVTDRYCGPTMFSQAKTVVTALSACTTPLCSTACKAAVQQVMTDQCCFASVDFKLFTPLVKDLLDNTGLARFGAAALCGTDITKKCAPPTVSPFVLFISLPNIDAAILAAKAQAENQVRSALIKDLASLLSLDADNVNVLGIRPDPTTRGGAQAELKITVEASLRDVYLNNFKQLLNKAGGVPLSNTAQAAQSNQATLVEGEPVAASTQGANNPNNPASGALHNNNNNNILLSSIIMIVGTFIAAFFFSGF